MLLKMDSEQACRIVRPSGCTRYSAKVLMAQASVPAEAVAARQWCVRPMWDRELFLLSANVKFYLVFPVIV